jgi:hypothetical protein
VCKKIFGTTIQIARSTLLQQFHISIVIKGKQHNGKKRHTFISITVFFVLDHQKYKRHPLFDGTVKWHTFGNVTITLLLTISEFFSLYDVGNTYLAVMFSIHVTVLLELPVVLSLTLSLPN